MQFRYQILNKNSYQNVSKYVQNDILFYITIIKYCTKRKTHKIVTSNKHVIFMAMAVNRSEEQAKF